MKHQILMAIIYRFRIILLPQTAMNSKYSFTQKQKNVESNSQQQNFPLLYGNFQFSELQQQIYYPRSISNQPPQNTNFSQYLAYQRFMFQKYGITSQPMNYLAPQHHPYNCLDNFNSQYYSQFFQKFSNILQNPTSDGTYQVKIQQNEDDWHSKLYNGYHSIHNSQHQHYQKSQKQQNSKGQENGLNSFNSEVRYQNVSKKEYFNLLRKQKVQNYLIKKLKRSYKKRIAYQCRKRVADQRQRLKGRFIKKQKPQSSQKDLNFAAKAKIN